MTFKEAIATAVEQQNSAAAVKITKIMMVRFGVNYYEALDMIFRCLPTDRRDHSAWTDLLLASQMDDNISKLDAARA